MRVFVLWNLPPGAEKRGDTEVLCLFDFTWRNCGCDLDCGVLWTLVQESGYPLLYSDYQLFEFDFQIRDSLYIYKTSHLRVKEIIENTVIFYEYWFKIISRCEGMNLGILKVLGI